MELKKFQLEASEKITNRYIAYMQNPLLIRRNEIVPFYQNLAAITGAGKTLVLADVVEQIRAVTTEQPIILWISKGKVRLISESKYNDKCEVIEKTGYTIWKVKQGRVCPIYYDTLSEAVTNCLVI